MLTVAQHLEQPARTIKPRSREYTYHRVVAIHDDMTLDEDGTFGTLATLTANLRDMPPTLFAKVGGANWVADLTDTLQPLYPTQWQWRASANERDICTPDGIRVASRVTTVIPFFGFKGGNYHKLIDPVVMYGKKLDEIHPGTEMPIQRLLLWAVSIRDFCDSEKLDVRPTSGGIAAQFLTDRRFYPELRRKVPAATNERVREFMPGNYYVLNVHPVPNREYTAAYLDQSRAHHYHAHTTALPDANHLYAHGDFINLSKVCFADTHPGFHGLYCLDLERTPGKKAFQWLGRNLTGVFVYSNELQHIHDMGFRVSGVRAAWGSRTRDMGIPKYAKWCETVLDTYADAPWLKPILLSTYGVLATKPRHAESVFCMAKSGDRVELHTGKNKLSGLRTRARYKLEPRIANVLHRGMIEAATRSESVGLAQELNATGHRVLSIYADAVIVEIDDDNPLPTLPTPWRTKETLNHLQFINQQAFTSGEMTKLPGVSRELMAFRQHTHGRAPSLLKQRYDCLTGKPIPNRSVTRESELMATAKQIDLFRRMTSERDMGDKDVAKLREQFAELTDSNASAWIERVLELPKQDTSGVAAVPPPF